MSQSELSEPFVNALARIQRLPSIELQTLAFFETCKELGEFQFFELRSDGYVVRLAYSPLLKMAGKKRLRHALAIFDVEVPAASRRRGWFLRYCQLCSFLVGDALFLYNVDRPELEKRLPQLGFEPLRPTVWVLFRRAKEDWLLKLG